MAKSGVQVASVQMFWSRPMVSDDMRDWIIDCFDWFDARFKPPRLPILPTQRFFKAPAGQDVATARSVLKDIKRHMGFDLPVDILPMDVLPRQYRDHLNSGAEAAGTYEETGDGRVIRYDPDLMAQPIVFINVLAHELMHARLSGLQAQVPGGADAHELATDLGCIIAGFGVFQLQAADDAGWSGYMTQPSRAFALAVFLDHRGMGPEDVAPHLSPRCQRLLKRAYKTV